MQRNLCYSSASSQNYGQVSDNSCRPHENVDARDTYIPPTFEPSPSSSGMITNSDFSYSQERYSEDGAGSVDQGYNGHSYQNPYEQHFQDEKEKVNQQKMCYAYLSELQSLSAELPMKYQQRIPHDVLVSLSSAVLDGSIFNLVDDLQQQQQSQEHNLFQQRQKCINELKMKKNDMERRHNDEMMRAQQLRPHDIPRLEKTQAEQKMARSKHEEAEVRRLDMRVIRELDQATSDQQKTLEKAGVPFFSITNNPQDIKLQMIILEWLQKLAKLDMSSVLQT